MGIDALERIDLEGVGGEIDAGDDLGQQAGRNEQPADDHQEDAQNQHAQVSEITSFITVSISALSQCLQKCRTIDLTIQNNEGGNTIWVN